MNELMYVESTNDGSNWIANPASFVPVKLTNYQSMSGGSKYAYDDIAAVYDYNGNLSIMWTTTPGNNALDVTLWHWDATNGVRKAAAASASDVAPGAWNRLIAKFTLGVEYLSADPAYDYLYFNYTKFSDNDIAADDYGNGDIYFKASSNGGKTWGPETNLTNSNTNGCAPPACSSEHWSSIAERVDSFQYVSYVLDHDAGGVPQSEGTFTLDEFALQKYPRGLVASVPSVVYSPSSFASPVEWAKNHTSAWDTLKFDNVGTAALEVKLSGPSWVTLSTDNFIIAEAGPTQTVNLTFNGGPFADTFLTGQIQILSNNKVVGGGSYFNDTEYVNINFAVTDTFYFTEFDTCKRGTKLVVSNVGNMGAQSDSAGMFYNGKNYLFDASPVMVTNQIPGYGNKGFSWIHSKADFTPEDTLRKIDYPSLSNPVTVSIGKVALNNWRISANTNFAAHWYWLGWTEWSKIIQFKLNGVTGVIVKNWWTWGKPPKWWMDVTSTAPVGGYFGIAGDWDVTSTADTSFSSKDKGGIIDSLNLAYLRQDSSATVASNLDKYDGGFQFLGAYVKKGGTTTLYTTPINMHIGNNATQMYPYQGYNDDSLMKSMSNTNLDYIEQDSAQDMNIIVSAVKMLNPDTTTEIGIDYALIVTDTNKVNLVKLALKTKQMWQTKAGDANTDGKVSVSDVVYLINFLFKGGTAPQAFWNGEANGDGKISVSDVVYLINFLFKGGSGPVWSIWDKPF